MPAKVRERPAYTCGECGCGSAKWLGRCPECQAWGTLNEVGASQIRVLRAGAISTPALPVCELDVHAGRAFPTGVDELDRVLGGGLVPGSVVLLAGEPGVGKSTLLLEVAQNFARPGARALIVSGEESTSQVRLRAGRIGALSPDLFIAAETDLGALIAHVDAVQPKLLVVDSVQTVSHPDVDGSAGGVTQVRECAAALIKLAKERGIATVLVGHVTKDGSIAGPRILEHLVDVVLYFEGDRHATLRLLRAVKNRFGAADEVGCFELSDGGIVGLADPSGLFLSRRGDNVAGTCVTVAIEGRRPLLVEVQALVAKTALPSPRRACSGLDTARVSMIVAVLERRGRIMLRDQDVFTATVGGVRLAEPSADLAVALAIAGSGRDQPMPAGMIGIGEVGLAGEVRRVSALERRLAEAARMGFTKALVPVESGRPPRGMETVEVDNIVEAMTVTGMSRMR
ncbi:MAG: DNA repair protein RadA [Actinomycetota bacterium]